MVIVMIVIVRREVVSMGCSTWVKPVSHSAILSSVTFAQISVKSARNLRGKEEGENWEVSLTRTWQLFLAIQYNFGLKLTLVAKLIG